MSDNILEFATTEEIIAELIKRSTFQGIIIYSADCCKQADWEGTRKFKVKANQNVPRDRAIALLRAMADKIENGST